ncbi:hypothetical protein BURKHO8Y_210365 [Burkholderia sp. 8Y]|nr:hypothetical protein BURKHO8Y_210365 [Burkholderia sp. 8Y]
MPYALGWTTVRLKCKRAKQQLCEVNKRNKRRNHESCRYVEGAGRRGVRGGRIERLCPVERCGGDHQHRIRRAEQGAEVVDQEDGSQARLRRAPRAVEGTGLRCVERVRPRTRRRGDADRHGAGRRADRSGRRSGEGRLGRAVGIEQADAEPAERREVSGGPQPVLARHRTGSGFGRGPFLFGETGRFGRVGRGGLDVVLDGEAGERAWALAGARFCLGESGALLAVDPSRWTTHRRLHSQQMPMRLSRSFIDPSPHRRATR